MRSLCLRQPGLFEFQEDPEPSPPGDCEALVVVHAIGICGTDLSGYLGKMPFIQYPRILGHELGVEVLQIGRDVSNIQVGDRCSIEPYLNCGSCGPCINEKPNCCEQLKVLGVHVNGGMTERLVVPAHKLHPSRQLTFPELALVETLAIGCHAVHRAQISDVENVLILGAGPIGLATLEFARLHSKDVTVVEPSEDRRKFIAKHYPDVQVASFPPVGSSFSTVFDATGNAQSRSSSVSLAAFGGKIVFVGITTAPVILDDPLFHRRELTLLASRNALPTHFPYIIKLIESGQIRVEQWISQIENLEIAQEIFARITSGSLQAIKVVLMNSFLTGSDTSFLGHKTKIDL
jgi:2-desacetyl-2-hydroxyethyl bacteriochlorophyllide A dehydrogenase